MLFTDRHVHSSKVESTSSLRCATPIARSTGTLVKSDTTSNEANMYPGSKVRSVIKSTNSLELRTKDDVVPTKGLNIFTRYFDNPINVWLYFNIVLTSARLKLFKMCMLWLRSRLTP